MALHSDDFARTVATGWGTSSDGDTYSIAPVQFTPSVSPGAAVMTGTTAVGHALHSSASIADGEILIKWKISNTNNYAGVICRYYDTANFIRIVRTAATTVLIQKCVANSFTTIATITIGSTSTNTDYWMRARWVGTIYKVRCWADGAGEPSTWTGTGVDSATLYPYSTGQFGCEVYCSGNSRSITFGSFAADTAANTQTTPATGALSQTASRTVTTNAALSAVGTARTVTTTGALSAVGTGRTVPTTSALEALGTAKTVPATGAVFTTSSNTVPVDGAVLATSTNTVPADASLTAAGTGLRTVPSDGALEAVGTGRTVTTDGALSLEGVERTVTTDGALLQTSANTIPADGSVSGVWRTVPVDAAVLATTSRTATADGAVLAATSRTIASTTASVLATTSRTVSTTAALSAVGASRTVTASAALERAYYVSTTGSNGADGNTPATAWLTLAYAAANMTAKSTVYVLDGTYTMSANSAQAHITVSGTGETTRTTFRALNIGGAKIVNNISANNTNNNDSAIFANGDFIDIIGFDISGANGRIGILAYGKNGSGSGSPAGSYNRVMQCYVHDLGQSVNKNYNVFGIYSGQYSTETGYMGGYNEVSRCVCINIGQTDNVGSHSIYMTTPYGVCQNNLVGVCPGFGINIFHFPHHMTVSGNLVFSCGSNNTTPHQGGGIYLSSSSTGTAEYCDYCTVTNNIIRDCVGYAGLYGYLTTTANNTYIDNAFYGNSGATYGDYKIDSSDSITGSVTSDPLFVDYQTDGTGDYHLVVGSPCIDAGTATGASTLDLDGRARPYGAGYDIGPYEFYAATLTRTTPTSGALMATGTARTVSTTAAVQVTGITRTVTTTGAISAPRPVPSSAALQTVGTARTALTSASVQVIGITRTVPSSAALEFTVKRTVGTTGAMLSVNTRTVSPATMAAWATLWRTTSASGAVLSLGTRTVTTTGALLSTNTRTITTSAALMAVQTPHTVPATGALLTIRTRTATASGALLSVNTRTVTASGALVGLHSVPVSAALLQQTWIAVSTDGALGALHPVPTSAALVLTRTRVVTTSGALGALHTVPVSVALIGTLTRQVDSDSSLAAEGSNQVVNPVTVALSALGTARTVDATAALGIPALACTVDTTAALEETGSVTVTTSASLSFAALSHTVSVTAALTAGVALIVDAVVSLLLTSEREIGAQASLTQKPLRAVPASASLNVPVRTCVVSASAALLQTNAIVFVRSGHAAVRLRSGAASLIVHVASSEKESVLEYQNTR